MKTIIAIEPGPKPKKEDRTPAKTPCVDPPINQNSRI